jgi:hypothetical protein
VREFTLEEFCGCTGDQQTPLQSLRERSPRFKVFLDEALLLFALHVGIVRWALPFADTWPLSPGRAAAGQSWDFRSIGWFFWPPSSVFVVAVTCSSSRASALSVSRASQRQLQSLFFLRPLQSFWQPVPKRLQPVLLSLPSSLPCQPILLQPMSGFLCSISAALRAEDQPQSVVRRRLQSPVERGDVAHWSAAARGAHQGQGRSNANRQPIFIPHAPISRPTWPNGRALECGPTCVSH